ncbi:hypothetical protein IFM89_030373 [Coptis chinensis]|uniref:FBD domain-containing protein n=1 Tax=Coptis chinensis TaxID=261450 RepID=A0A835H021_9MAGN|nr:hypothetical protein IFM89_030373 [Coptis chinensis]
MMLAFLRPNGSDEMARDVIDHCVSKIIFGLCSMVKLALRGTYVEGWPDTGGKNVRRYWLAENISSDGILKNLRKVQIKYFEGSDIELELVKYLLKNASILEKADIFVSLIKQTYEKEHISMKVHTFARASPCVEISVF